MHYAHAHQARRSVGLDRISGPALRSIGLDRLIANSRRVGGEFDVRPGPLAPFPGTAVEGQLTPDQINMLNVLALADQAGAVVRTQKTPTDGFLQPLPLPEIIDLAPGAEVIISAKPNFSFSVQRPFCPSFLGPYFTFTRLEVGMVPQYVGSGAISASMFSEVAVGLGLKGDTCTLGQDIQIGVKNVSAVPRSMIGAAILGFVVR